MLRRFRESPPLCRCDSDPRLERADYLVLLHKSHQLKRLEEG